MNTLIKSLAEQSQLWDRLDPRSLGIPGGSTESRWGEELQEFAELIVQHCIGVCEEMAAQCGGLPGDGALARDCAHWIRKDFGVAE